MSEQTVTGHEDPDDQPAPLVDFPRTARRVRRSAILIGAGVVLAWLAGGLLGGELSLSRLATLVLPGLVVLFLVEVWVVGGSAVRGMLAAGARGERLAGDDVAIVPPQLRRRRTRTPERGA